MLAFKSVQKFGSRQCLNDMTRAHEPAPLQAGCQAPARLKAELPLPPPAQGS